MSDFAAFWEIARHMRGRCPNPRKPAQAAWDKAIKNGADPRMIIAGLKGFDEFNMGAITHGGLDYQFVCMASVFINQERWEQYLGEPAAKTYLAEGPRLRAVK